MFDMAENVLRLSGDETLHKSEMVELALLEKELTDIWGGFNPWMIRTHAPALNRYTNLAEWECKNCNHVFSNTIHGLETMQKQSGHYCPNCKGSHDPVWDFNLLSEYKETEPKYIDLIRGEYLIMSELADHYGCQPYSYVKFVTGESFTLMHKSCSTIFSTTFSLIYGNDTHTDPYTGKPILLPFCPRCNKILERENKNYGGIRFVERLATFFENHEREMPYIFRENYLFQFKDLHYPMMITCKYCDKDFKAIPYDLFTATHASLCPHCDGKPLPTDSAESTLKEYDINESNQPQISITEDISALESSNADPLMQEKLQEVLEPMLETLENKEDVIIPKDMINPKQEITSEEPESPQDLPNVEEVQNDAEPNSSDTETVSQENSETPIPPTQEKIEVSAPSTIKQNINLAEKQKVVHAISFEEYDMDEPEEYNPEEDIIDPDINVNDQINAEGYPDTYAPAQIEPTVPFANPPIVDSSVEDDSIPVEESLEDEFASINEINRDFAALNGNQQFDNELGIDTGDEIPEGDIFADMDASLDEDEGEYIDDIPQEKVDELLARAAAPVSENWFTQPSQQQDFAPNATGAFGQPVNGVDIITNESRPDMDIEHTILGSRQTTHDEQDDLIDDDILNNM
jgi:hypothetical protein